MFKGTLQLTTISLEIRKHEYHAMCFPNRIDGEQAVYKSLKPFSLSFAWGERNRVTNSAFRLSAMKQKPKLLCRPIRGEEIIWKNRYDFKVKTSKCINRANTPGYKKGGERLDVKVAAEGCIVLLGGGGRKKGGVLPLYNCNGNERTKESKH